MKIQLMIYASLVVVAGCEGHPGPSASRGSADAEVLPVAVDPSWIDLGSLPPGRTASSTLTLSLMRPGSAKVTVVRVETGCPCVKFSTLPAEIGEGRPARLRVTFDPAEEPDFRGNLSVPVTGTTRDGSTAFRSTVAVAVQDVAGSLVVSPESLKPRTQK